MGKRKSFEDELRRQRHHVGTWMKYATWEESQEEFARARSVFERALDVDYKATTIWLKYAEMEMRHKFVNHARNVWDRAVTLLPRVAQFWYKYAFMEEMLGNLNGARRVFERWMEWQPDDQAWYSYIKLEMRAKDIPRARSLYERYVLCHPGEKAYIKYAKWEERSQKQLALARKVYERALEELRSDEKTEQIYLAFALFEERCRELERARAVFKYALDTLPKEEAPALYSAFITFEKQHGDKERIEEVVIAKRRVVYEQQVAANALDYDSWLEYIKLEENEAANSQTFGLVRDVYERAIANVPPIAEKKYWRRYIYLWIKYALFEELLASDNDDNGSCSERCKQVYKTCLKLIPHDKFTFAKIWILYTKFLIRQRDVQGARMILGEALGRCPKKKLFTSYIELELMMGEIDRCRKIYMRFLEFDAQNCETWQKYAMLERQVGEIERARAIYELATKQPVLDMPEMIWKHYIDFEIENDERENTRALYERLLERTKHVKVWISFAQFEASSTDDKDVQAENLETARDVFERALRHMKEQGGDELKEDRVLCMETWLAMEKKGGDVRMIQKVSDMLPRKVTKQRMAYAQDGAELGLEEYTDYIFPDDEQAQSHLKLLQAAQLWKQKKPPEETQAERELLNSLPEFQEAAKVLLGQGGDEARLLPNHKRAEKALPKLQRTVEICRSAMGFQSVYLQAALRHLVATLFMKGDVEEAKNVMQERGDVMQWPIAEHERMLRLLLRSNLPKEAEEWCQKEEFTKLFPRDETVPLKWTLYELIGTELSGGAEQLVTAVEDPMFVQAVETLRKKKAVVLKHEEESALKASEVQLGREIPYLLAQYASLSVISTRGLERDPMVDLKTPPTDTQLVSLNQAEALYKEALEWVEKTAAEDDKDALLASGPNGPFGAWVETNIGEVLLRKNKPEEAMEWLGKAMSTLQAEQTGVGGSALAMTRVLGQIARGCHKMGQAVTSEGLFVTVVESFERESKLSTTDRVEFARVLRSYGDLLANWEKREAGAKKRYAQAQHVEQELAKLCQANQSTSALHPIFYLPL
ncbi:Pre-mRNA-splicing factor, Crooked neck [Phytophthora megakarya]|uniref:Pre-mRNA-splicing factor, Crooked neck n=1 Tax=Phytophthora megakarya TaxID=4795 RepID=A0A225WZK1_9STRA|nr:Pre-mRNA-splicing factor, Crooked neck [Phytophthora megakarya]